MPRPQAAPGRILSEMDSAFLHPKGKDQSLPAKMRLVKRRGTLSGINLILKNSILGRKPFKKRGSKIETVSEYCKIRTDFHRAQMNKSFHCFIVTQGRWQNNRIWELESWYENRFDPRGLSERPEDPSCCSGTYNFKYILIYWVGWVFFGGGGGVKNLLHFILSFLAIKIL